MNIESIVCSLDLARRLKELGVKQDSFFYWMIAYEGENIEEATPHIQWQCESYTHQNAFENWFLTSWSAFTAGELLELLPAWIDFKVDEPFNNGWLKILKRSAKNIQYIINYECDTQSYQEVINSNFMRIFCKTYDEKFCDALAKMLIYLIENGHVKAEDL